MNVLLWGIALFLLGLAVYLCVPIFLPAMLPMRYRDYVPQMYYKLSMQSFRRVIGLNRKHAGFDLLPSSYDPEKEGEKVSISGDEGHAEDPHTWMGRLHGRPFGLVHEERNVIVHPMVAEIGRELARRNASGEETRTVEWGDGATETLINRHVTVDDEMKLVNLADAKRAILGSGKLRDGELGEELAEKSQAGYNTRDILQGMSMVIALLAGAAGAWFIWSNSGSGRDSAVKIPIWVGGHALDLVGVVA